MRWPFAGRGLTLDLPDKSVPPSARFAFNLFHQRTGKQKPGNIFFSPASVMVCLWMPREGAIGETRESMDKVLEVAGLDPEALRVALADLRSALQIQGPSLQLEAANSLWCNQGWMPRPEYLARIKEEYDSEINTLDFRGADAVARVNSWVSAKLEGRLVPFSAILIRLPLWLRSVRFTSKTSGPIDGRHHPLNQWHPNVPDQIAWLHRAIRAALFFALGHCIIYAEINNVHGGGGGTGARQRGGVIIFRRVRCQIAVRDRDQPGLDPL